MDDISQWSVAILIGISIAIFLAWLENPFQILKMDLSPKIKG